MTNLLELVKTESEGVRKEIIITSMVSGLANAAVLAVINEASQTAAYNYLNFRYLMMFIVAMTLYVVGERLSSKRMIRITAEVVQNIRVRLADKIQNSELAILERIGKSEIMNAMSQEATVIAESGETLTRGLQAGIFVVFALAYVAYISLAAFLITLVCISIAVTIVTRNKKLSQELIRSTREKEIELLRYVTDSIDGFKETRTSDQKRADLRADIQTASNESTDFRVESEDLRNRSTLFGQSSFYVLIGSVVFLLPNLIETYTEVITEITTAVLFMVGPLTLVVGLIPFVAKCNESAKAIFDLEEALDNGNTEHHTDNEPTVHIDPKGFKLLELDAARFAYRNQEDEVFVMGPLSLAIEAPEIIFITGGNGSGKSTLLKVLAGLYRPDEGHVSVDGTTVTTRNIQSYREIFSTIFSDFHVFEKLYGALGTTESEVSDLLEKMQLDSKVKFVNDTFTTLDLSTGQRKRLALVVSLLDDKPVFIFDELAADQDPEFRKFLYEEVLPGLKSLGHTVIAASHDDRYFHVADKLIKMEYGKIEEIRTTEPDQ